MLTVKRFSVSGTIAAHLNEVAPFTYRSVTFAAFAAAPDHWGMTGGRPSGRTVFEYG